LPDSLFWTDKRTELDATIAYLSTLNKSKQQQQPEQSGSQAAAILRKIRGVADGTGELKFRLTAATIQSIFSNLPRVKRLHEEFVGTKMLSEKEFWTQFVKSRTFGREMGVGEDAFAVTDNKIKIHDNIFDRAFASEVAVEEGVERRVEEDVEVNTSNGNTDKQQCVSAVLDVSRNEDFEYYSSRDQRPAKQGKNVIKDLNCASQKALNEAGTASSQLPISVEDVIDIPDLHRVEGIKVESNMSTGVLDESIAITTSAMGVPKLPGTFDPNTFANLSLYSFQEYQEHLLGTNPVSPQFQVLSESDFTLDHFELARRLHQNLAQLLRLFWRLPPSSAKDRVGLLGVADKLCSQFNNSSSSWPEVEQKKAYLLLTSTMRCVQVAKEKVVKQH
jgi:hypothetical protein